MPQSPYPILLSPYPLGPLTLRNRLIHVSMSTDSTPQARVTPALIQYHANRARGGVAMIITEPIGMIPRHATLPRTQAWNDDDLEGFRRWSAAVTNEGAHLLAQIQDAGRGRHAEGRNPDAIGASVLPDDLSWTVPRAMSVDEIRAYVDHTAQSARRLQNCGFAGVELSCGHGHLFHQFLSPWMNRRTDAYGGDRQNRTRFITEIMAAIRALCGPTFLIGLKLPGDDGLPGSIDAAEAFALTATLAATNLPDFISYAWGAHARTLEMHVPDRFGPRLPYSARLRALKPATGPIPLIAIGRITDPADAEAILQSNDAPLIGLGRALVADPAFLLKAAANRTHDIRFCISCNTCWGTIVAGKPIACVNNPSVAQPGETDFYPAPTPTPRRITIIGTGPAGLEAAWTAAARGHHVTVFGQSETVGGKTLFRALLPGGDAIASIPNYQHQKALKAGATFILGRPATLQDILATTPDTVILATGSQMIPPDWLSADRQGTIQDLRTAIATLPPLQTKQPGTAIIVDMDHSEAVYAAALHLNTRFQQTIIVTPRDTIAQELHLMVRQGILRRIAQANIRIIPYNTPIRTNAAPQGSLDIENVHTTARERLENIAFLAYATPRAPNIELAPALIAADIPVIPIGDAIVAGELLAATATGHAAGMEA